MTTFTFTNILPNLVGKELRHLAFTVVGQDGNIMEEIPYITPCSLDKEDPEADYTDEEILAKCSEIAKSEGLLDKIDEQITIRKNRPAPVAPPPPLVVAEMTESQKRSLWMDQIDNTIANIQGKYTRFQVGYVERETAAKAYVDSNYTGDPTTWITRFADNVGMEYPAAADLILSQASHLRDAVKNLEDLRMDKYLIARAATIEEAEASFNTIIAAVYQIEATL